MMTEICCSKRGWRRSACPYKAKIEVDGKHYCGVHDPRKADARRAKKAAISGAEASVFNRRCEVHTIRQELVEWALAHPEAREITERFLDAEVRLSAAREKLSEISR